MASYLTGNYLDAIFITRYLSVTALGVYSVAYLIVGTFLQLPTLGSFLLQPFFISLEAGWRGDTIKRYLTEVCPAVVLGWSLCCTFAAAGSGYLLPLLFGPQYASVSALMWPMMATAALAGPVLLGFGAASNAWLTTKFSFAATGVQAVLNIALNIVLIPRFGLIGCAWASTLAAVASLLVWTYFISARVSASAFYSAAAVLPAVVGAGCAGLTQSHLVATTAAVVTFMLFVAWRHRSLRMGARAVLSTKAIRLPARWPRLRAALPGAREK